MSINPDAEELLSFSDVASRHDVHVATVRRWHLSGVAGVKLETIRIGGKRYTSDQALHRFHAATTANANAQLALSRGCHR